MQTFIIRLELHPSDKEQNYSAVHRALESQGFSRIYTGVDGVRYHLPSSEYCIIAKDSAETIRDRCRATVSQVTAQFMLLVIEAKAVAISGLIPVKEAARPVAPVLAVAHVG